MYALGPSCFLTKVGNNWKLDVWNVLHDFLSAIASMAYLGLVQKWLTLENKATFTFAKTFGFAMSSNFCHSNMSFAHY